MNKVVFFGLPSNQPQESYPQKAKPVCNVFFEGLLFTSVQRETNSKTSNFGGCLGVSFFEDTLWMCLEGNRELNHHGVKPK